MANRQRVQGGAGVSRATFLMAGIAGVWLLGFLGMFQRGALLTPPTYAGHSAPAPLGGQNRATSLDADPRAEPRSSLSDGAHATSGAPAGRAGPEGWHESGGVMKPEDGEYEGGRRRFQIPPKGTQQSDSQLKIVWEALNSNSESPKNLLVFGLGMDSNYFANIANRGGKTVFIEDNPTWIDLVTKKIPGLSVVEVKYTTKINRDFEKFKDKATWPLLFMSDLPKDVLDTQWDVIIVDAPNGCCDFEPWEKHIAPGRFQSMYMARWLALKHPRTGGTLVTVDDCERKVESLYAPLLLGVANLTDTVSRRPGEHESDGQRNKQCYFRI